MSQLGILVSFFLVSFFSGEITSYPDTSYCINILWEVSRSFFLGHSVELVSVYEVTFPEKIIPRSPILVQQFVLKGTFCDTMSRPKMFFFSQGVGEGGGGIAPYYFRVFFMNVRHVPLSQNLKFDTIFFQVGKNASVKKEISFMEVWSACKCDILHCASKETYHFFRVSPTKIQSINMNHNYMDTD